MIIKPLLILCAAAIFAWFLRSKSSLQISAWKKIGSIFLFIFALLAIIFPNLTDRVAHLVGVGRGTDLLLYILTLTFMGSLVVQYEHNKEGNVRAVALARKVAINEANADKKNQKKIIQSVK